MDLLKPDLAKRQEELNEKFRVLEAERQVLLKRIDEVLTEQIRLQGEFRLLDKLKIEQESGIKIPIKYNANP